MKHPRVSALALLGALILALSLSACSPKSGGEVKDVPAADLFDAIAQGQELPAMMDLDSETLASLYGISPDDDLVDYVAKAPMMMVHSTELFVAKVADGRMDAVKEALEKRQDALEEQWSQYLPDQLELVQNYKLVDNGPYVLFAICGDPDAAVAAFQDALK